MYNRLHHLKYNPIEIRSHLGGIFKKIDCIPLFTYNSYLGIDFSGKLFSSELDDHISVDSVKKSPVRQ